MTLEKVLTFVTGCDEEPALGFAVPPSILFVEDSQNFIQTASTCINQLKLPRGTISKKLPSSDTLFGLYDYAFWNSYFGLV